MENGQTDLLYDIGIPTLNHITVPAIRMYLAPAQAAVSFASTYVPTYSLPEGLRTISSSRLVTLFVYTKYRRSPELFPSRLVLELEIFLSRAGVGVLSLQN